MERILKGTLEATSASVGMIFLRNPETGCLELGASIGLSEGFVDSYRSRSIQPGEGLTGRIAESGGPIYIAEDSSHDERISRAVIESEGLNTFIGVPVRAKDEIVAVMNILSRPPDVLTEQETTLISAIGTHVGFAIHNAQLFKERKQAEETLRESEDRFRQIVERSSDVFYRQNISTARFEYVSPKVIDLLGITPEEMQSLDFEEQEAHIHPDDLPSLKNFSKDMLEADKRNKGSIEREFRIRHKSGEYKCVRGSYNLTRDANGEPEFIVGGLQDITERMQAEMALKQSEENFRALAENAVDGILITGLTGNYIFANQRAADISGYSIPELLKKFLKNLTPPEAYAEISQRMKKRLKGEQVSNQYESTLIRKDGEHIPIEITAAATNWYGEPADIVIVRDITARKQAEEALRDSEEIHRTFFESSKLSIVYRDADGRVLSVNPASERIFGESKEKMLEQVGVDSQWKAYREDGTRLPNREGPTWRTVATGREVRDVVVGFYPPGSDTLRWVNMSAFPLYRPNETKPFRYYTIVEDITKRKRAEIELKESQLILQESQRVGQLGSYVLDIPSGVWTSSDVLDEIFGIDNKFARSIEGWVSIIHPDWQARMADYFAKEVIGKRGRFNMDYQIKRFSDGAERWVHGRGELSFDDSGNPVKMLGTIQDITERKQAQEERENLIRDLEQKNAEMERFNYTISHDLKSPLITIKGFISLLEEELAKEKKLDAALEAMGYINKAVDKMHLLLDDLLDLSRVGRLVHPSEKVALGAVVEEVLELLSGPMADTNIVVEVDPNLPIIYADRISLFQVMQNLIENGIKFMGDQKKPTIKIGSRVEGEDTVIYVQDNGIGIKSQYHDRIFGLFRQLEPSQAGSGVGLTLVKRIIELHGGRIWVESEGPGKGCSFCFVLPES